MWFSLSPELGWLLNVFSVAVEKQKYCSKETDWGMPEGVL